MKVIALPKAFILGRDKSTYTNKHALIIKSTDRHNHTLRYNKLSFP